MREVVLRRVERVRGRMRRLGLSAIVAYSAPTDLGEGTTTSGNVRALSGWADRSHASILVLPVAADPVLLVDSAPRRRWAEAKDVCVRDVRAEERGAPLGASVPAILRERHVRGRVGVVGEDEVPAATERAWSQEAGAWVFVPADDVVARERMVKTAEEIKLHRAASNISDAMHETVMRQAAVPGVRAWELLVAMECSGRSRCADYSSGWIATGTAPDMLGFDLWQNERSLEEGDRIQVGTSVVYQGYWAHALRMATRGPATHGLQRAFDVAVAAEDLALESLRPGARLRDIVAHMTQVIDEHWPLPLGAYRGPQGHALGLDSDDPIVSEVFASPDSPSDLRVEAGMVLAVHPNFRVPGLGFIGVGDVVLITASGAELLTRYPRELAQI